LGLASLFFFAAGLYTASLVLYEEMVTGSIVHVPSVVLASLLWTLSAILSGVGVLAQIMVITRRRIESLLVGKRVFERRTWAKTELPAIETWTAGVCGE
jgi:hypothetical protein